eukprot:1161646-Pelagomonas_calceolata.AAC.28
MAWVNAKCRVLGSEAGETDYSSNTHAADPAFTLTPDNGAIQLKRPLHSCILTVIKHDIAVRQELHFVNMPNYQCRAHSVPVAFATLAMEVFGFVETAGGALRHRFNQVG